MSPLSSVAGNLLIDENIQRLKVAGRYSYDLSVYYIN